MRLLACVLGILAAAQTAPPKGGCEVMLLKKKEIDGKYAAWKAAHEKGCTLCPAGTLCREGFEASAGVKDLFEGWMRSHRTECTRCAARVCNDASTTWNTWISEARTNHKKTCDRRCGGDEKVCARMRSVIEEVRTRFELWKQMHPATCRLCAPACPLWRARVAKISEKRDLAVKIHRPKCVTCRAKQYCERYSRIKSEWTQDCRNAWKLHIKACPCTHTSR